MKKSIGPKTIIMPNPVLIVGTYDKENKPNLMNAAWGGICCSKPPMVAVSLRAATYSHGNIMQQKAFTVNILPETLVKKADYYGLFSGRDENKFEKTKITEVKSDLVNAPYAKEFPFVLECKLHSVNELGLHTQFIGEIMDVKADDKILGENGLPDIKKLNSFVYSHGNHEYYAIGKSLGKAFSIGKDI